jgi:3-deoxy-manno-octulosonate cytidylyltransferase (CMP-KDO synthetase)
MNIVGIIPARMASTRFPNKPLAPIMGMPMISHVYHRSRMSTSMDDVWIATCDREVVDYVEREGGNAVMTSDSHQRASDRAAEAMEKIEKKTGTKIDFVAMIQGDEPMLMPEMLDELAAPARSGGDVKVVNLISPIEAEDDFRNPNTVKVVFDVNMDALYFSREPIPSGKKYNGKLPMWKQLGIILFRRDAMIEYTHLAPTPLEVIESVDMNRFIEHGVKIRFAPTTIKTFGVDTPGDLARVEELMKSDALAPRYVNKGTRK